MVVEDMQTGDHKILEDTKIYRKKMLCFFLNILGGSSFDP